MSEKEFWQQVYLVTLAEAIKSPINSLMIDGKIVTSTEWCKRSADFAVAQLRQINLKNK